MEKEELEPEIQIGRFKLSCPDEDGDYYIRIGGSFTNLGTEEMKDIAKFINSHLSQSENGHKSIQQILEDWTRYLNMPNCISEIPNFIEKQQIKI